MMTLFIWLCGSIVFMMGYFIGHCLGYNKDRCLTKKKEKEMVIIHELFNVKELNAESLSVIEKLRKKGIVSVVKIKDTIGVARAGTNRGTTSQLYKYVKGVA